MKISYILALLISILCLSACEQYYDRGFYSEKEEAELQKAGYHTFSDYVEAGNFGTADFARYCYRKKLTLEPCKAQKLIEEEEAEKYRKEQEKAHRAAREKDGIYSQSDAFSRCKDNLRNDVDRGYFDSYSDKAKKMFMSEQIDRCMNNYGYTGR